MGDDDRRHHAGAQTGRFADQSAAIEESRAKMQAGDARFETTDALFDELEKTSQH